MFQNDQRNSLTELTRFYAKRPIVEVRRNKLALLLRIDSSYFVPHERLPA